MSIDSYTKNYWISMLTNVNRGIGIDFSASAPEGESVRSKLSALIDEVNAIETVEPVPAEGSTPAVIFGNYGSVSGNFYAIPATEAVLAYLDNSVRRKSRPALNAELAALNVATHEKSPDTVALMTEEEINTLLDTSADRLGRYATYIQRFKSEKLYPFATRVDRLDGRGVNFASAENSELIFHAVGDIIEVFTWGDDDDDDYDDDDDHGDTDFGDGSYV